MAVRLDDDLVTLGDVADKLLGRPVHFSTVWRWATQGAGGVLLETVCIGRRRYTTAEAFRRFVAATTAQREAMVAASVARRDERRRMARAAAPADRVTGRRGRPRKGVPAPGQAS